jgi:tripartite motif-containing protein 71
MDHVKLLLVCIVVVLLAGCAPTGAASPEAPPAVPTINLATSSVEFELEIKGDPYPLSSVVGVTVDEEGNLYVADCGSNRIQKFDSQGNSLSTLGSKGGGDGELYLWLDRGETIDPKGDVAVDAQGRVYVADIGNSRIQVFDSEGQFLLKWGGEGMGDGQFYAAVGIAVSAEGDVYVADSVRGDVQRFDSQGQFLDKWSIPVGEGPSTMAPEVDAEGYIYIPSREDREVHRFDSSGKLLGTIGEPGRGDGQFVKPVAVAVDHQGNIYVADETANCVQKFDREGNFLTKWGSMGAGEGQFRFPVGLAVAPDGSVYVSDANNRVQKFRQQ